jgi:capsular polysaccharide biosynthesis protein
MAQASPAAPEARTQPAERRSPRIQPPRLPALVVLARSWKFLAAVTSVATLGAAFLAMFVMPKWYRAEVVLRPVSEVMPNRLAVSERPLSVASVLDQVVPTSRAEELITTVESFQFSLAMVKKHHLEQSLRKPHWLNQHGDPSWEIYRTLKERFACEYSISTGNLTLYYKDRDRTTAQTILGYYVDDLRAKLREEQVSSTRATATSLKDEAGATPDPLLQQQLFQLIAEQLQQQKLAMVDANFAFKVIDAPKSSDRAYSPSVGMVTGLAFVVTLFLSCLILLTREQLNYGGGERELALASGREPRGDQIR